MGDVCAAIEQDVDRLLKFLGFAASPRTFLLLTCITRMQLVGAESLSSRVL